MSQRSPNSRASDTRSSAYSVNQWACAESGRRVEDHDLGLRSGLAPAYRHGGTVDRAAVHPRRRSDRQLAEDGAVVAVE